MSESGEIIIFYRICCKVSNQCTDVFVGHTTNLVRKKHFHKLNSNNSKKTCTLYSTIRKYGGWANWKVMTIASKVCVNQSEIDELEGVYMNEYNHTLNVGEHLPQYNCECCALIFKDKFNLEKHYRTKKHLRLSGKEPPSPPAGPIHTSQMDELVLNLLTTNTELTQKVIELSQKDSHNNTTNNMMNSNNTTHNTKFNLNFFLNDTCKDALNIGEFIQQLVFKVADLVQMGEVGFAPGLSTILMKGLNELDLAQRPLHCSDAKRNILYIKDVNGWEKDEDRTKITKAIHDIARKNFRMLPEWQKEHPNYQDYDSKENTDYMRIIGNAMVGGTDEEIERNFKKIIHAVAQAYAIPKPDNMGA